MTLDARKLMADKGVKPASVEPMDEKVLAEEEAKRKEAAEDNLSNEELINQNEDNMRAEKKEEIKKNAAFDAVSDDVKADAINEQLGLDTELVQMHVDMGANGIFGSTEENTDEPLEDLTSQMREERENGAKDDDDDEQQQ